MTSEMRTTPLQRTTEMSQCAHYLEVPCTVLRKYASYLLIGYEVHSDYHFSYGQLFVRMYFAVCMHIIKTCVIAESPVDSHKACTP